jgi:predicted transcriptional regulator
MAGDTITIRTDPELVAQLTTLAAAMNRSRNGVVEDALRVYLENQAGQIEEIQRGLQEADASDFASDAEVDTIMQRWSGQAG